MATSYRFENGELEAPIVINDAQAEIKALRLEVAALKSREVELISTVEQLKARVEGLKEINGYIRKRDW